MKLPLIIDIPDEEADKILYSMAPLLNQVTPGGLELYRLLDSLNTSPLKIVETGCVRNTDFSALFSDGWSTWYLARWVSEHPGSTLVSIEIDSKAIEICGGFLKSHGLEKHVRFLQQDSIQAILHTPQHTDVFFLDSCDGLQHGLDEFLAAVSKHPKMIIMDDWETKIQWAAAHARQEKIPHRQVGRYTVFDLSHGECNE